MDTPTSITNDESDEDILLTFYRLFHTFEQALRKTGFTRWVKRTWEGFACHVHPGAKWQAAAEPLSS